MQTDERLFGILASPGLHESEIRVYLALLEHPALSASTLSKVAGVPRSHLYKVLEDLQGDGLVEIMVQGGVRAFRARPLAPFLTERAALLDERRLALRDAIRAAKDIQPPPRGIPGTTPDGEVRLLVGRAAVARQIDELIRSASRRLLLAGSDGGYERVLRQVDLARDMTTHLILPRTARHHPRTAACVGSGSCDVRWFNVRRRVLVVIQDDERGLFVDPSPDTQAVRSGKDFAILASSRAFNGDHRELLFAASTPDGERDGGNHLLSGSSGIPPGLPPATSRRPEDRPGGASVSGRR